MLCGRYGFRFIATITSQITIQMVKGGSRMSRMTRARGSLLGTGAFGVAVIVGMMALSAPAAWAQITGSITGRAEDSTGGVLPGVTVVGECECLIGGARTTFTDGTGRFNLVDLAPGTYTVSFTLGGFGTYVVEAVELTAGFTATANAAMEVGGVEETITVTGSAPLVDIQNVQTRSQIDAEVLEALPSGMRDIGALADLTLGANTAAHSVGGNLGEMVTGVTIHGARGNEARFNFAGMNANSAHYDGGGTMRVFKFNMVAVDETVVDTSGSMASVGTGGANLNLIPRDGGNIYSARTMLTYANDKFTSGKVPQELLDRGLNVGTGPAAGKSMSRIWDYGVGAGGPIARDRAWFYSAYRNWGSDVPPGTPNFFNKSTDWRFYEADLSRPAETNNWVWDVGGRLTAQVTEKQRFSFGLNVQRGCTCFSGIGRGNQDAPASSGDFQYRGSLRGNRPMHLWQGTYTYPMTNNILVQAGTSNLWQGSQGGGSSIPQKTEITEQVFPATLSSYDYNAINGANDTSLSWPANNWNQYASVSYITGSHQLEVGLQMQEYYWLWPGGGVRDNILASGPMDPLNALNFDFNGGVPVGLTMYLVPVRAEIGVWQQSLYVQDQWTLDRVTLNLGLRYDHNHAWSKALTLEEGPFSPVGRQLSFPRLEDLPNYHDISPRVGAAWDLFGDGRTALKASWGRYVEGMAGGSASAFAPAQNVFTSTGRTWTDTDGDYFPDCVFMDPASNGECGAWQSTGFGGDRAAILWDDGASKGWGKREAMHRISAAVQHELLDGVGLEVSYHRAWWVNHQGFVNTVNGAADYRSYCMTAPTDSRLGSDLSGTEVCGLWEPLAAAFANQRTIRMLERDIPGAPDSLTREMFNGVDFAVNARFDNGALVRGGVTLGQTAIDHCWANDLPHINPAGMNANTPRSDGFCDYQGESLWNGVGSQMKFQGVYPLPYGIMLSGNYKDVPGITTGYDYRLFNFEVASGQTVSTTVCELSGFTGATATDCPRFRTVRLAPEQAFQANGTARFHDKRIRLVDVRVGKNVNVGGMLVRGYAELYNVFNNRPTQSTSDTAVSGTPRGVPNPNWPVPFSLLGGRTARVGVSIDY